MTLPLVRPLGHGSGALCGRYVLLDTANHRCMNTSVTRRPTGIEKRKKLEVYQKTVAGVQVVITK